MPGTGVPNKKLRRGSGAEPTLVSILMQDAIKEQRPALENMPTGTTAVAQVDVIVWASRRREKVLGCFPAS